jgi:regulator of sigma D
MVAKLLDERQEVLTLFCRVAGLEPYAAQEPLKQPLKEFCQVLMDYMAFGHFEVYDRISRGEERRGEVVVVAEKVYPKVAEATEVAVSFNDKYDDSNHRFPAEELAHDLSVLGEELAARVEMEDRLITAMMV